MPKYRIEWDIGYGPCDEVIEADNLAEAQEIAYEAAREDFESQAMWKAEEIEEE